jgi:D-arabinose 1-dehydrogenase-like Zn-dependent alcohol dehydrogenase
MRALILERPNTPLKLTEVPRPEPGPGEVLVKVKACGVGLTVVNACSGRMRGPTGEMRNRIPGHEIAGVVEETRAGAERFKPGDRVLAYFYLTCDRCRWCLRGRNPLCDNFRGYVGRDVDGGYAEYIALPENALISLPDEIDDLAATVIPDAVGTPVHVLGTRANLLPGDTVMVIGAAGGVGIHMVQVAKLFGVELIAVDLDDAKLEQTRAYGADHLVNFEALGAEGAAELVQQVTGGRGVDTVVETVGTPETIRWAYNQLGKGGTLVNITTHPGVELPIWPGSLVQRELSVIGSRYLSKAEYLRAIDLVRQGKVRPVVSRTVPLSGVEAIHADLRGARFFGRGVTKPELAD